MVDPQRYHIQLLKILYRRPKEVSYTRYYHSSFSVTENTVTVKTVSEKTTSFNRS